MPSILKHPCDSWMCDVPKIQTIAQPRAGWGQALFLYLWDRGQQRFTPYCSQVCGNEWTLQCFRQKHVHPNASVRRSDFCSSRHHTSPPRLSLVLPMVLTGNTCGSETVLDGVRTAAPVLTSVRRLWVAHSPRALHRQVMSPQHQNSFNMVAEQVSVRGESAQPACCL